MSNKLAISIILGLSIATHFIFFGLPKETVFDEVHFGKFVSAYFSHEYYFDIHPPLGKLLIAGVGKIVNFSPEFDFSQIGEKYNNNKYMALRSLPTLAGTLLPLIIYLLCLEIGFKRRTALLAGLLIVFENSILVQSRLILMDAFLILFGFIALLFYFKFRNKNKLNYLLLTGIFSALAFSIKWTGMAFLGIVVILELLHLFRNVMTNKDKTFESTAVFSAEKHLVLGPVVLRKPLKSLIFVFRNFLPSVLFLVIIPALIYFSIFVIHFSLLTKSGTGDAFMTSAFQSDLIGNPNQDNTSVGHISILNKFLELNEQMYISNQGLTATHSYSSKWYPWPLMIRPIYYWVSGNAKIYFLGNPIIWWFSTMAVVFAIIYSVFNKFKDKTSDLLLGMYLASFLPFIFIGRVMFLYHYMSALIFAIMLLAYNISQSSNNKWLYAILIATSIITFVYFAPLTYGLPIIPNHQAGRLWLTSWQ